MITFSIVVLTLLPVLLSLYVFFTELPALSLDEARSRLFRTRAQLFELAARERVGFRSPAYRMQRDMINGSIRFAHDLSVIRLLVIRLSLAANPSVVAARFESEFARAKQNLPDETRHSLDQISHQIERTMLRHMVMRSAFLHSIWMILLGVFSIVEGFEVLIATVAKSTKAILNFPSAVQTAAARFVLRAPMVSPVRKNIAKRIDGEALRYVVNPSSVHVRDLCPA